MTNNQAFINEKVREFVRKYYLNKLLRGALLFVAVTLLVFIIYAVLEYFSYFSTSVRTVLFFSYLLIFGILLIFNVLIPVAKICGLGKQLTKTQIADIIGKHFPEIDDKLLNIFQLEQMIETGEAKSVSLLSAAIDHKIDTIRPFPFTKAINFKKTARYAKWGLIPVLLFLVICTTKSEIFTQSSKRIIHYDQAYQKPAPYQFVVQDGNLSTFQNEEFTLHVQVTGEETPKSVFIAIGNKTYQLSKTDNVHFTYTFKHLQANTDFHIFTDEVSSQVYTLKVLPKPVIISFAMQLHYPAYLHKPDEVVENNGDATIPDGTQITWTFYTRNTKELSFILPERKETFKGGTDLYKITKTARGSFQYAIANLNQFCISKDTLRHSINIIPDQYPEISVVSQNDSVLPDRIYFRGSIKDDYGFSKVRFVYTKFDKDNHVLEKNQVVNIDINTQTTVQDFFYYFDAAALRLEAGYHLDYYFEVFDNDGVNGAKSARTSAETFRVKTEEEIDRDIERTNSELKSDLQSMLEESQDLLRDIEKMEQKMLQEKNLSWQDKKKLEELTKQYEELKKQIDEMKQSQNQQNMLEEKFKDMSADLIKKQQELEKRFDEVLSDEIKEMFEKLQKMLEQTDQKDKVQEAMRDVKANTEELNKALDQQLELFKQLEFEKKFNDIISQTKKLAEEQKALSKQTESKALDKNELQKKQQDIEDRYKEVKKDLNELEKMNQSLEDPNKLLNTDQLQKEIEQKMQESQDALNKGNKSKAAGSQQQAGEKMEEMAQKMEENMLDNEMENLTEDMNALRQIMDNLVQVSFGQEKAMTTLKPLKSFSSRISDVMRMQHDVYDNMQMIADSLNALAKRQLSIKPFIHDEVTKINNYLSAASAQLQGRNLSKCLSDQQFAMTSMNNLALMLAESMDEMKKQKQQCMKKKGNCNKSGGGSCSNPGGKGKTKTARELQQQLNRQIEALKRSMQQGPQQGQSGSHQSMSEQFARLAAQQEAIRKMMQDAQDAAKSQNGVGDKQLQQMINDMQKTEKELVNKQITTQTLQRQKAIETRMLESERAEMKRDQEEKRESTEGRDLSNPHPPKEWNVDKKTQQQTEMLKSIPADLNYYYKEKVNQYFYNIE